MIKKDQGTAADKDVYEIDQDVLDTNPGTSQGNRKLSQRASRASSQLQDVQRFIMGGAETENTANAATNRISRLKKS